jgi:hypothetical protein
VHGWSHIYSVSLNLDTHYEKQRFPKPDGGLT